MKVYNEDETIVIHTIIDLINRRDYQTAKNLCEKYKSDVIQSLYITILKDEKEFEKALEIGKIFPNNAVIQTQIINIHYIQKNYQEVLIIGKKFQNNPIIQNLCMAAYIKNGDYENAKKIGDTFKEDLAIQSQLISIHIYEGNYAKAKEIGERFPKNEIIQNQLLTIFLLEKNNDRTEEIAKEFKENEPIQTQLLSAYIAQEKYDKIEEIAKRFPNSERIQKKIREYSNKLSWEIDKYIKEENYEIVFKIGESFPHNEIIQERIIKLLLIQGKRKDAETIAERFPNNKKINKILFFYKDTASVINEEFSKTLDLIDQNPKSMELLEIIKNENDKWRKSLLYLAICDKLKYRERITECIESLNSNIEINSKYKNKLAILNNRIKIEKEFDKDFYLEMIYGKSMEIV